MSTISYLIAKAHANHSKSPTMSQINAMITADSLSEIEGILVNTAYGPLLEKVRPSVDQTAFEVEMRRSYADLLSTYRRSSTGDIERLLEAYAIKIEAENMDLILQSIMRGTVNKEAMETAIIPVGQFGLSHYARIMENTDVNAATDFITFPELKKTAQRALDMSDDIDEQSFLLSAALSHTSFEIVSEVAEDWVKTEVDFLNLETICRAADLGIDAKDWLVPNIGSVWRMRDTLSRYDDSRTIIEAAMSRFPVRRPLRNALDSDDPVVKLEDEALQYLYYRRYRSFMLFGNRPESALDYFSIKRAEIEDVSRIMLSTVKNISDERVRSMVYPIYKRN